MKSMNVVRIIGENKCYVIVDEKKTKIKSIKVLNFIF